WFDQRAYQMLHPRDGGTADLAAAAALYAAIGDEGAEAVPFVAFRRAFGMAYCRWKSGAPDEGAALARAAAEHAADGGHLRLRVMALNLLAHILDGPAAEEVRTRAVHLARRLEDEDLLGR